MGAELLIHGGGLRHLWPVVVGHDRQLVAWLGLLARSAQSKNAEILVLRLINYST